MSEISMESVCGVNSIMKRGVLHAPKEFENKISEVNVK
jgi:hypothetical protein